MLGSITEYYRVIKSITERYRVIQSVAEYYKVLQSTTKYHKILQSITKYYRDKDKSSVSTWTNFWACCIIVEKTRRRRLCYLPGLVCYFFASVQLHAITVFLAFCCENWHTYVCVGWTDTLYCWRGGHACHLMVFHAIFRQISDYLSVLFLCVNILFVFFTLLVTMLFIGVFFLVLSLTDVAKQDQIGLEWSARWSGHWTIW